MGTDWEKYEDDRVQRLRAEWSGKSPPPPTVTVPLGPLLALFRLAGAGVAGLAVAGSALRAGVADTEQFGRELDDYGCDLETDLVAATEELLRR